MQRFWHSSDRLLLMLLVAAVIHAILILGVTFVIPSAPEKIRSSLDITLVTNISKIAPEKADFRAQANQIGGGENPKKVVPRSEPELDSGAGTEPLPAPNVAPSSELSPQPVLKQAQSEKKVVSDQGDSTEEQVVRPLVTADAMAQPRSELSAEMNRSLSDQAHGPKIVDINQVSAKESKGALYERNWQDKIERVGTLHFPEEAYRRKLSGAVTLSVGVKADGSIYSVNVDKSSGYDVLDDAAKRIVRLAAPFAPLPLELREAGDVIVFTKKWVFFADKHVEMTP